MKNLKYQLLILLLLLAMVVTVFGGMFIWITDIDLIFKIVFTVACILLSIYIFIGTGIIFIINFNFCAKIT